MVRILVRLLGFTKLRYLAELLKLCRLITIRVQLWPNRLAFLTRLPKWPEGLARVRPLSARRLERLKHVLIDRTIGIRLFADSFVGNRMLVRSLILELLEDGKQRRA